MRVTVIASTLLGLCLASAASGGEPARDLHLTPLPKGVKARLGFFVDGPNAATHCPPSMSPDGKLLASVVNARVQVWDVASGRVIHSFDDKANPYPIFGVAFVDNDTLHTLHSENDKLKCVLKAWDVRAGKLRRSVDVRYDWHGTPFTLANNGKLLSFITGGTTTIRVWDADAGKELFSDAEPHGQPFFSSNDKHVVTCRHNRLAFGKYDAIVAIRDARTGKTLRHVEIKDAQTFITDVSPDGKYLVGHTNITHEIQDKWRSRLELFDAESGKLVRTFLEQRTGDLKSAVFSPDGKFVSGVDHTAQALGVWEVDTGKKVWSFPNDRNFFNYPRFSRDAKTLLNTTSTGSIYLHDMQTGATRHLNPSHYGRVQSLAFSADGKRLASASNVSEIFVWDIESATLRNRLTMTPAYDGDGKHEWVSAYKMAFAPDGKHLLAQQGDQAVRLFSLPRSAELRAFRDAGHVWGLTENGKHLLWTGVQLDLLQRLHNTPKQVRSDDASYWLGAGRWLAYAALFPELQQFRPRAYASAKLKGEPPPRFDFLGGGAGTAATPFGLSPDGSVLAEWIMRHTGNPMSGMGMYWVRDSLRLSDTATGQEILRTKENNLGLLIFAADSRSFVSFERGPKDKPGLKLFETRTGRERLHLGGATEYHGGLAFSPDGRWFAFINGKNAIEIVDVTLGKTVATLPPAAASPPLMFSPDGSLLASGDRASTILLWDLKAVLKCEFNEPAWTDADKDRLWNDLADADVAKAFAAMCTLKRSPTPAVGLIRDRLQWLIASKELDKLIERLGSADFATRKKANDALEQLGERARPALAKAVVESKSLEHKRRVELLLEKLQRPFTTPVGLRLLRAIEVLDGLRTADAAALLREIAADVPDSDPLEREVARALERVNSARND